MFSSTGTKLVCEKLTPWQSFLGNSCGATAAFARPRRADLLFIGCQRMCLFDSKLFRVLIYFYLKPHILRWPSKQTLNLASRGLGA